MDGLGSADQVERAAVSPGDSTAGATHTREVDPLTVTRRLQREGRWKDIEHERDEMMKLAKDRFDTKEERQQWVYSELDRLYPPILASSSNTDPPDSTNNETLSQRQSRGALVSEGPIQGLSSVPDSWPELPANASMAAEVAWVQANRLRIVEERPGRATVVDHSKALSPAPSWAALGWLETSIRSYAKFVDVAAKAASGDDGEASVMKRERMAIEEMEGLLNEMREADPRPCPHCGKPI